MDMNVETESLTSITLPSGDPLTTKVRRYGVVSSGIDLFNGVTNVRQLSAETRSAEPC